MSSIIGTIESTLENLAANLVADLIPSLSQVAPTSFTTGPNDQVAAVDAYGTNPTAVINNLNGNLSNFNTAALDGAQTSTALNSQLTSLLTAPTAPYSVSSSAMTARVSTVLGGNRGVLSTLTSALLAPLVAGQGLNASTANQLSVTVGSVTASVNNQDPATVLAFNNMVTALVGGAGVATIIDDGAQASLLTGILATCIGLGLSSLIAGILASSAGTVSGDATTQAIENIIELALLAADLKALEAILAIEASAGTQNGVTGITSSGQPSGQAIINAMAPNATSILLSNYKKPGGGANSSPVFYNPWANELIAVLTGIDPDWDSINRNGTMVNNLEALMGASADALTVLQTIEEYLIETTIAKDYTITDPLVAGSALIPDVTFVPGDATASYGTANGAAFTLANLPPLSTALA
jgi:hypothetical protein